MNNAMIGFVVAVAATLLVDNGPAHAARRLNCSLCVDTNEIIDGAITASKLGLAHTFFIEDSGDDTGNCNRLRDRLGAVTSPALVVLSPGTFACATNPLIVPRGVSVVGAGQNLTNITGSVVGTPETLGVVRLAGDDTALRDLTVINDLGGTGLAVGIVVGATPGEGGGVRRWRISDVTARALNGDDSGVGLAVLGADCEGGELINFTAEASGNTPYNYALECGCATGSVVATNLKTHWDGVGNGIRVSSEPGASFTVRNSAITGLSSSSGSLKLISSELDGGIGIDPAMSSVTCVGSYNGDGVALMNGSYGDGSGGCEAAP